MDRVALTALALIAGGAGISYLLSKYYKKKWVWYIPSMIGVLFIAYLTFRIETENMEGFEELGYVILSLMVITFMTGNLLTNIFITLKKRMKKKRNNKDTTD